MKKSWIVIVALTLLASSGWANLLSNGDFETRTVWTVSGNGGFEEWAAHSATGGIAFWGWSTNLIGGLGTASFYQQVPVAATGTYTAAIWVRRETDYRALTNEMKLGWYDSIGGQLQPDTTFDFTYLPNDGLWHHLFVTGTCDSSALAQVRFTVSGVWTQFGNAIMFDDADLYQGPFVKSNRFVNNGFERGRSQRASGWSIAPELNWDHGGGYASDWWAARQLTGSDPGLWGSNAIALYSWDNAAANYSVAICQTFDTIPADTNTFTVWIKREANHLLTTSRLQIAYFDLTFTNMVQDRALTNIVVPNDGNWHEYYVRSAATNPAYHEVRVEMDFAWAFNPAGDPRSMMIDDTRLFTGTYAVVQLQTNWAYYQAEGWRAHSELVPGTNVGAFFQVNYRTTTNTSFILTETGPLASYPAQGARGMLRTSWQRPSTTDWVSAYWDMTKVGSVSLTNNQFHGLPSGGKTVDVWRADWAQPRDTNGVPYTAEVIRVYYTPYVKATNDDVTSAYTLLLYRGNPAGTNRNNLGQILGDQYSGLDYYIVNAPPYPIAALTNANVDFPPDTSLTNSGWRWQGDFGRETWAARYPPSSSNFGGFFMSWFPGESDAHQDILTTGGVCTFTAWVNVNQSVSPSNIQILLDWYDTNWVRVQRDSVDLTDVPRQGNPWHLVGVTGTCLSNSLWFVRPTIYAWYGFPTNQASAGVVFDDTAFYAGSFTFPVLLDGGFERGDPAWSYAQFSGRDGWAGDFSPWGADFQAWDTNQLEYQTTINQPVLCPGTGTYSFSVWMSREQNVLLTNMELRLEWYDGSGAQLLQQVSSNVMATLPADNLFREYYMNGTCTSPAAMFVRPVLFGQWQRETNFTWGHANKIDNLRLMTGAYVYPLRLDWTYHNAGSQSPFVEQVPGTSNFGAFAQVSYASTTTTFFVLADELTNIAVRSDETAGVGFRTAWQRPPEDGGEWVEQRSNMTWVGTADLSAFSFHGSPLSGSQRVNIWRIYWQQPLRTNGVPYTNTMQVYFSPYLRTTYDNGEVQPGRIYLAQHDGTTNNNYASEPQLFHTIYAGVDYVYTNARPFSSDIDGDGIPNDWESAHGMDPGDPTGTNGWFGDPDGDTSVNGDEFIADTDPQNGSAYFDAVITGKVGFAVIDITAGPPTTNTRLYGVYWKTNLVPLGVPWLPQGGVEVPGNDSTTVPLTITITNGASLERFYRTGVRVP